MKRSLRETIELLVFALIALLVGIGLLWLFGWILGIVGFVFKVVAGFIWMLLKYIIPLAIIAAAVYALIKLIQNDRQKAASTPATTFSADPPYAASPPAAPSTEPYSPVEPPTPDPSDTDERDADLDGDKKP